jgi:hypothetical protein
MFSVFGADSATNLWDVRETGPERETELKERKKLAAGLSRGVYRTAPPSFSLTSCASRPPEDNPRLPSLRSLRSRSLRPAMLVPRTQGAVLCGPNWLLYRERGAKRRASGPRNPRKRAGGALEGVTPCRRERSDRWLGRRGLSSGVFGRTFYRARPPTAASLTIKRSFRTDTLASRSGSKSTSSG